MPPLPDNSPANPAPTADPLTTGTSPQLPPVAGPPRSWNPLRTLLPALVMFALSVVTGVGLFLLIAILGGKSPTCSELAIYLCVGVGVVVSIGAGLIIGTLAGARLLRRARVEQVWKVLLVTDLVSVLLFAGLSRPLNALKLGSGAFPISYLLASLGLFIASCIFSDWYLNALKGQAWVKIVLVLLAAAVVSSVIGGQVSPATVANQSGDAALRSDLSHNDMTLLVPPPNSSYPQPYDIAANDTPQGGLDYKLGAYFGIDTGVGQGSTLYEYKVAPNLDPLADCGKITTMLVAEYLGQTTCRLVSTLPSGTKIYGPSAGGGDYFIIKNGTAAVFVRPSETSMTDDKAYDFLDHLVPLDIEAFLRTLHQKNPQAY